MAPGLLLLAMGCQTDTLTIQRTFPFTLTMDAFPASIALNKPTSVGFAIKPDYLTSDNTYTFSWQLAAPQRGELRLNQLVLPAGGKIVIRPNTGKLMTDSLTYVPVDSGAHQLRLRIFDSMGQQKDTTFTLTAVR